ncbi:MAG TPA: 3-hydroxyacyl-CoA dehydrogenase NAD-binding domain-containing protein [Candidatus Limnocylindrales bacterium]|nr:3-hydroxyacyl-CoA dehydrogenase NAD-binding domain-containing protein [Candidatus Limnocylindrales bacterium]
MAAEVAVIGAGTMGAGIAQLALEHGHPVRLIDVDPAAVKRARIQVEERLAARLARSGLSGAELDGTLAQKLDRLTIGADFQGVANAAVVIEAVIEDLEVKRRLVAEMDRITPPETIIATNTSALSVGAIAQAAAGHPDRVLGLHFFNPAPVMPLVEVVAGAATDPAIGSAAAALVAGWGRTPVHCADRPGFIVNRVNRPFTIQALRELERGEATTVGIDTAFRTAGFPLGPFQLMDLIGIDVNLAAATAIWNAFGQAQRFRPSPIQARLVAAGRLGRKTGEGFYRYDPKGAPLGPAPDFDVPSEDGWSADVVSRIRGAILDEAVLALDEGVAADAATIDLALRLGASHPEGPFEWSAGQVRPRSGPTIGR